MSSSVPPDDQGQPAGQPQGQPEYLEQGSGAPLPADASVRGRGRRTTFLAVGAVAALAVAGGATWAAVSFFATGPQPAEALPASTLGYASVDLDPSGSQKIAALRMLKKFPAFAEEVDLDTDDDLREKFFEEAVAGGCEGVDYGADIEPWLGDRAAVAAVDLGDEQPAAVAVLQVTDAAAAEDGFTKVRDCGGSDSAGGWAIDGEWAVLAETESIAEKVAAQTVEGSLADDSDYQRWTDEVGDSGIVNLYASPEAGAYLADSLGGLLGLGLGMPTDYATSCGYDGSELTEEELAESMECVEGGASPDLSEPEVPSELTEALEDFGGMAVALRFDDGGLELEYAGDSTLPGALSFSDTADDVLTTLPDDTAVALGLGLTEGWSGDLLDRAVTWSGGMSTEELLAEAEAETGLDLPDDAETLAGESIVVAVSSDVDPDALANGTTGSDLPIGVKIRGDAEAIEAVLDKLRAADVGEMDLASDSDGDLVVVGPNADYLATLLDDGGLGDLGAYQDVVAEAGDAGAILFVNFDAGGWLDNLAEGDTEVADNLAPLEALGLSGWVDGEVGHAVLRLTTN